MENCLVEKLKSVVNNDNLDYLGYGTIEVSVAETTATTWAYDGNVRKVKVIGNGTIAIDNKPAAQENTTYAGNSTCGIIFSPGTYKVLYEKYYMSPIDIDKVGVALNTQNLEWLSDINTNYYSVWSKAMRGDIKYLSKVNPSTLFMVNSHTSDILVYGDVSTFSGMTNATELQIGYNIGLTGDIASFGSCTALTRLGIQKTSIGGSIEGFVSAARAAGRTSCQQLNLPYLNENSNELVTFNGTAIPVQETNTLSWDASTITFNGVTITA